LHRVAVFLDYQNVYMQARRCFGGGRAGRLDGQVDPLALGNCSPCADPHFRPGWRRFASTGASRTKVATRAAMRR